MLKIKKKKQKVYDFKYIIYWKNGSTSEGYVENSVLAPEELFLDDALTYFAKGKCCYFNKSEIKNLEIFDLVEKVEE